MKMILVVLKSQKSSLCSIYTETQPQSFQTKTVCSKVSFFEGWKHRSNVTDRLCVLKRKYTSVNRALM